MKQLLVLFIIILFFNVSSIPSEGTIGEKSLKLISDGNILYVGGSGEGNYTKIQDAINNANDGDTVFVYDDSSPYNENLIVSKSINLFGENRNTTIINGSLNQSISTIIISSEHVILSGFTIQRYGVNNYTYNNSVIYIESDYNIISGNILTGNITCGIQIDDSQYNNISSNVIKNDLNIGILLYYSNYTNISNNYFLKILSGIGLQYSNNNDIISNFISNCGTGIFLLGTKSNCIYGNIITNNEMGIRSESYIQADSFSTNNTIIQNNISYNKFYGLFIMNPLEDEVIQNNFIGNKYNAYFFYQIYYGLRARYLIGSKPYIFKIFWNSNYWDEPRLQSYFIPGFITFFSLNYFIRYIRFLNNDSEPELYTLPINWFNMDKHPAKKPYNISI